MRWTSWIGKRDLLVSAFCAGLFSTMAQVVLLRELLVAFCGNELCIGLVFFIWFSGFGIGALAVVRVSGGIEPTPQLRNGAVLLLALPGILIWAQVYGSRVCRTVLQIPAGETVPIEAMLIAGLALLLPSCILLGAWFPLASRLTDSGLGMTGVRRVYVWESLGSAAGGAVLAFLLLPAIPGGSLLLVGGAALWAGAACLARRWMRALLAVASILAVTVAAVRPDGLRAVERRAEEIRWESFGALSATDTGTQGDARLMASVDTVYQNLALIETAGQNVIYGNGRVLLVFPDPVAAEHRVHFLMAQNPTARRVLLIGGDFVGDAAEVLKYPVERLVCVTLDPGVLRMVQSVRPDEYRKFRKNPRVEIVLEDGPRYVQRCAETFDVVALSPPEPATAWGNRFFTVEFFQNVRRILTSKGFLCTAVPSSARMEGVTAMLGATVYRTLQQVFPCVQVTADTDKRLLAGGKTAGLTLDRRTLFQRSSAAAPHTEYFRPEYFLGADELDPEKIQEIQRRWRTADAPVNSCLRPVSLYYSLLLWSRQSGFGIEDNEQQSSFCQDRVGWLPALGLTIGAIGLLTWLVWGVLRKRWRWPAPTHGVECRRRRTWDGIVLSLLLLTTGFLAISAEIVLVSMFQGLYGYLYTRLGLVVAFFMLGLATGGWGSRFLVHRPWFWLAVAEAMLAGVVFALPEYAREAAITGHSGYALGVYPATLLVGIGVGVEFPLINLLWIQADRESGRTVAFASAIDHFGAAAGALLFGSLLAPVWGMETCCRILAALKGCSLLLLCSAYRAHHRKKKTS